MVECNAVSHLSVRLLRFAFNYFIALIERSFAFTSSHSLTLRWKRTISVSQIAIIAHFSTSIDQLDFLFVRSNQEITKWKEETNNKNHLENLLNWKFAFELEINVDHLGSLSPLNNSLVVFWLISSSFHFFFFFVCFVRSSDESSAPIANADLIS